jgi:hypothetical protein
MRSTLRLDTRLLLRRLEAASAIFVMVLESIFFSSLIKDQLSQCHRNLNGSPVINRMYANIIYSHSITSDYITQNDEEI